MSDLKTSWYNNAVTLQRIDLLRLLVIIMKHMMQT